MADRKKTPARKTPVRRKKATPRRKKRRWLLSKFLLIIGCVALLGFLGIVMFLDKEARRMGIFTPEVSLDPPRQDAAPASLEGDYTPDEKRQLEAILESEDR
jgi:hypothetical protein